MKSDLDEPLKQTEEPTAFVIGKYATTGLGVTRCLGRLGIPVIWLDSNPNQSGFFSKYCNGIVSPNSNSNEQEFIDFLLNIGEKLNDRGVLFPTGDGEVITLLKHRKKLEKYYNIPMADLEYAEVLINKRKFYQTLEKQGIRHPKTYFLSDFSEIKPISKEVRYPCIVKPAFSESFQDTFKTKFFRVESSQELIRYFNKAISKNQEMMIQEIIPGNAKHMHGFNAYYDKNFKPNGVFMYRRIREWPPNSGNGCLIENVVVPELEHVISHLVKNIKYYGIVDAEFKQDPRDGEFNLIEINPRCWMQISLPYRCGINLPYIAYQDALGEKIEEISPTRENMKWLFMFQDIISALRSMVNGELSFRNWINSYKGNKEFVIFARDDPLPFFRGVFKIFQSLRYYRK